MILSGRQSIIVAVTLSIILCLSVAWSATHHRADTRIDRCALVQVRGEQPRCLP